MSDNVACALAYIPIVGLIFLLIEPYNRNKTVRFHAFQSLFLFGVWFVFRIVLGIFLSMLWGLVFLLPLVMLASAAIWIFLMYKAYTGERIVLPIIGPLAEKQA